MDPTQVVMHGYDVIAERYTDWAQREPGEARERYTQALLKGLPPGARVLDLGCGAGLPTTRRLAQRFRVVGVDLSARQVALARHNVPNAVFLQADITALGLAPGSMDGVCAFFSIIHVPRDQQPALLRDVATWLRPGGLFVATLGVHAQDADLDEDWLGAPMYWSSYDAATNRHLVEQAGLCLLSAYEMTDVEHGAPATFLWVIAVKPSFD